jgi:hypothetical protein
VVHNWATHQIDLVTDDISKGSPDALFKEL